MVDEQQATNEIQRDWKIIKTDQYKALLIQKTFVLKIIGFDKHILKYLPDFNNDVDVVEKAVMANPSAFKFASELLKQDKEFVIKMRLCLPTKHMVLDKLIPEGLLREIEPYSRRWLDEAVVNGNFEHYQLQAEHNIVPEQREKLIGDLLRQFVLQSQTRGYFEIFKALIHDDSGQKSLLIVARSEAVKRLCMFCLASDSIFNIVIELLRFVHLFVEEMTTQLTKSLFYTHTDIERDITRLDQLAFGHLNILNRILTTVFKVLNLKTVAIQLDFNDVDDVDEQLIHSLDISMIDGIMTQLLKKVINRKWGGGLEQFMMQSVKLNLVSSTRFFLEKRRLSPDYSTMGTTLSMEAVQQSNIHKGHDMLRLLYDFEANFKKKVIHEAYKLRNFTLISYLLELGANINEKDHNGCTVLHLEVKSNIIDIHMVTLLLDLGANIYLTDDKKESILHHLSRTIGQDNNVRQLFDIFMTHDNTDKTLLLNGENSENETPLSTSKQHLFCELMMSKGAGGSIDVQIFKEIVFSEVTSAVVCKEQTDLITFEKSCPCPCRLNCRHVSGGEGIWEWLKYGNNCPKCRAKIKVVEVFSLAAAVKWDEMTVEMVNIEAIMENEISNVTESVGFIQLVLDIEKINNKIKIENKEEDKVKRASLVAEQEQSTEEKRKKEIRRAANICIKTIRDNRVIDSTMILKF